MTSVYGISITRKKHKVIFLLSVLKMEDEHSEYVLPFSLQEQSPPLI